AAFTAVPVTSEPSPCGLFPCRSLVGTTPSFLRRCLFGRAGPGPGMAAAADLGDRASKRLVHGAERAGRIVRMLTNLVGHLDQAVEVRAIPDLGAEPAD